MLSFDIESKYKNRDCKTNAATGNPVLKQAPGVIHTPKPQINGSQLVYVLKHLGEIAENHDILHQALPSAPVATENPIGLYPNHGKEFMRLLQEIQKKQSF